MDIINAAKQAYSQMAKAVSTGSRGGCGRVYVEITDHKYKSIRKGSKVAKAFEAAGFKMFPRPGYTGVRIYIGYDNATGKEWAQGEAVAESLKAAGIPDLKFYVDGDGD